MARNIEIKAYVKNLQCAEAKVLAIAQSGPEHLAQTDTYFSCPMGGLLKLREFSPHRGELIYYSRAELAGPKASNYSRTSTIEPQAMRQTLKLALGETGTVSKLRTVYMAKDRARIHLDRVDGLGDFIEIEVVLDDSEDEQTGIDVAEELMALLEIAPSSLIATSYFDLLREKAKPHAT